MVTKNLALEDERGRQIHPVLFNTAKDGSGTWYYAIVNSDGHQEVGHDITTIGQGVKTVSSAGTDVALASSTPAKLVIIQAQTDNTDKIAVGGTGVDATVATGAGVLLDPGDTVTLPINNLANVFIDSLVSGEGVRYTYFA